MQQTRLYLDTARLGRMSPRAQQAHVDITRLAGEEGASVLFERFLRDGSEAGSESFQSRYPGLTCWKGVSSLKHDLRTLAGSDPDLPVLMVNRSAQLMKFAARLLFRRCRNVLITDLVWPPYQKILEDEARRTGRTITPVDLGAVVCADDAQEKDVVEAVRTEFTKSGCDGLFLTAVSHLGLRLPAERVVRGLERVRPLRVVVIDGAQDFCHVSADLSNEYCDLYLAGCHKWLQGFHPMGLGFYGRRRSRARIELLLNHLLAAGELDDPLLRFTTQLESTSLDGETETVNLMPLFTCQGAAADALQSPSSLENSLRWRQVNLTQAASVAESCGWQPVLSAEPFRTGILLMQAERDATRDLSPFELRSEFAKQGIAVTTYKRGFVRLSMPASEWHPAELDQLRIALHAVA